MFENVGVSVREKVWLENILAFTGIKQEYKTYLKTQD
jgi:hypothetical protein